MLNNHNDANLPGMQNLQVVDIIDFTEPKLKNKVNLISGIGCLPVVMIFGILLAEKGYSEYLMFIIIFLLIPGIFLHEYSHFLFQWIFSRHKPHIGFTSSFPYSALSPASIITRNQAIWCALAPLFIVSFIILVLSIFVPFLFKLLLWAWASVEVVTCYGDFYLVNRLRKHPSDTVLRNVDLKNVLYKKTNITQ